MKLARREAMRFGLYGALLGVLGAFLASELGLILSERLDGAGGQVLAGIAGFVVGAAGWSILIAALDAGLVLLSLVIAFTPLMSGVAARWIRSDAVVPVDAVVVLSGGLASNGGIGQAGVDRLLSALEIIHSGKSSRLVTTRIVGRVDDRRLTTDADQRRIINLSPVPQWDVVDSVGTTHDEAVGSAALLLPVNARHI